jgi:hypothetical protein
MPTVFDEIANSLRFEVSNLLRPAVTDRLRAFGPWIDGIEVTQTIQYYKAGRHLTDPATRGMDNSLVLAAYKPAWVRTYARPGFAVGLAGATARLTIERRNRGFLWAAAATLPAQAPGIIAPTTDYATERSSIFSTLNFIIPAADCWGILRLTVELFDSGGRSWGTSSVTVHATLKQTLRLRAILIGYNGPSTAVMLPGQPPPPNLTLAAPTLADLQTTAARALLAMPVQATGNFAVASTITFNQPLDDARSGAGQCSRNWDTLLRQLATERTNDGNRNDVVYFGLLPAGMPVNVPGCGDNGLGAGRVGDPATLLHEIGHGYGFMHTPCGAAGTTDANYPQYSPYPRASIGEYAMDISNGTIFSPQTTSDYMSYCFPQWMSLYQHQRLVGHTRLDPSWISDNPIWDQYLRFRDYIIPEYIPDPPPDPWKVAQMRPDAVISIIGVVRSSTEVEVTSVARVLAASTLPGRATPMQARLLDANGAELARGVLHELSPQGGCGCDGGERRAGEPPFVFQAMIADVAPGAALVIGAGERVLWERRAPAQPPEVGQVYAEPTTAGTVRLSWQARTWGEPHEAWVQWSNREGKVWHGLATGLTGGEGEVSLTGVPAGEVLLRVLVHDGFHTAVSEPVRIQAPRRPPEAAILSPAEGQLLMAGSAMRLWGAATDSAGAPLPAEACLWLVDGRDAGRGLDLWMQAPPPGEHRVTLIVRNDGDEVRRMASFTTLEGITDHCR